MRRHWIWGIAGITIGVVIGLGTPGAIEKLRLVPVHLPPPALPRAPPPPNQVQREAFIADCIEAARGSIKTPSSLRVIGNPKFVRHEKAGQFYLDAIFSFDAQNTFGATVRRTAVFCSTSIDRIYGQIIPTNIMIDGMTNFNRALNDLKSDIPEENFSPAKSDITEFEYVMQHGT